jgi:type I restriction enzyme S subunit
LAEIQSERPLPDGWVWTTLEEVCLRPQYGWTTKAVEEGELHLLRTTDITSGKIDWESVPFCREEPADVAKYLLHDGDIVISRAGSIGYSYLVKRPKRAVFASYLIRFKPLVEEQYVAHFLQSPSYWESVYEERLGIAVPNINATKLKGFTLPLAPLPEQRRIVAEIETQFTRLDAGVAALERAQANLRRYKASVLKAACEGRLVPTEAELARAEGRDYEPADQLLARILAERRAKWEAEYPGKKYKEPASPDTENMLELPERWVWGKFEQLISSFRSGSSAVPQNEPTDFPILRSSSVRPLRLDCNDVRFVTEADSQRADNFLQEGDLLFTRLSGSLDYVGNCALVKGTESRGIQYPDRLFRAQLVEQGMGQYVEICFASSQLRKEITAQAKSTAGHQRISMGGIREQVLPLPPLAEQRRIVAEVERWLSVVNALEREVEAALAHAARLRRSILKRAFEGRLVPQDPDDEPASVLLERIRAKREVGKGKGSGKKKRKPEKPQQLEMF